MILRMLILAILMNGLISITFSINDYLNKIGLQIKLKFYTQKQKGIVEQFIKIKA